MEGTLVVPDGLTFVADSGTLEDGIATTLNWTGAGEGVWWTPWSFDPTQPGLLNGFGAISYTGTDKLALMKFQCTVDNDATAKDYEVTLIDLVADDENYDTKNPTCIPATVTVTPATGHVCASHLTKVEAKPADCINPGNKAYYKSPLRRPVIDVTQSKARLWVTTGRPNGAVTKPSTGTTAAAVMLRMTKLIIHLIVLKQPKLIRSSVLSATM